MKILNITKIYQRIITYPLLKIPKHSLSLPFDTFTFSGNSFTKAEIKEQKREIKAILQKTKDENKTITIKEISEELNDPNLNESRVYTRLHSDSELKELWFEVKSKENIVFSQVEKTAFDKAIGKILADAQKHSKTVTISYLAEKIGVNKEIVLDIINKNDDYKKIYEQVRKCGEIKSKTPDEVAFEEKLIEEMIVSAIKEKKKLSIGEVASQIGISKTTVRKRISDNSRLGELYIQVKNPVLKLGEQERKAKESEIEKILEQCAACNHQMKNKDIIKAVNISLTTFYNILSENEKINSLWQAVKSKENKRYTQSEIETLDNYIHRFLLQKREKNESATMVEIAQHFGVSKGLINTRIKKNPSLKYQWDKVKSQDISKYDDILRKEQTKELLRILQEFCKTGKKTTKSELASLTGLSTSTVQSRIENSTTARSLWNEVKTQTHINYSQKQINIQYETLYKFLEKLVDNSEYMSVRQISEKTGIKEYIILPRIFSDSSLTKLWTQVKQNKKPESDNNVNNC